MFYKEIRPWQREKSPLCRYLRETGDMLCTYLRKTNPCSLPIFGKPPAKAISMSQETPFSHALSIPPTTNPEARDIPQANPLL